MLVVGFVWAASVVYSSGKSREALVIGWRSLITPTSAPPADNSVIILGVGSRAAGESVSNVEQVQER